MGVGSGQEGSQATEKVERIQDQLGSPAFLGLGAAKLVEDASVGGEGEPAGGQGGSAGHSG